MKVSEITRAFKYKTHKLDDIPGLPEKEIMKVYAGQYPELVNGTVRYHGLDKNNVQQYEFVTTQGTKG